VSICCIVGTFGIVGPFFFDNDNDESITVTAEHCVAMMQNFLLPQLEAIGADPKNLYAKQNGATVHTNRHSINTVCNLFHKVILGFRDIPRLAHSLDIMVPDFLLLGYLKERVYRTHNHTAQEMELSRARVVVSRKSTLQNLLEASRSFITFLSLPFLKVVATDWLCYG
jgi:hypothetical protein